MEEKQYIKLDENKHGVKLWITTADGVETGEYLKFYMTSIELLDKWDKLLEEDKKARIWFNKEQVIIDKKQDFTPKGKYCSNNTRLKLKAQKEFILKEKEIYDMFLGEHGVDKLLNGEPLEWDTLMRIDKIIKKQIFPYLKQNLKSIDEEIKNKYKVQETEVLE